MTPDLLSRALSQHAVHAATAKTSNNPCGREVSISFFFDGFGHDEGHKSIDIPSVSNLAKLYFAHIPTGRAPGVYVFYYEGLGARFPPRQAVQDSTTAQLNTRRLGAEAAGVPGAVAGDTVSRRVKEGAAVSAAVKGALKETLSGKSIAKAAGGALMGATLESWDVTRDSEALAGLTGSGVEIRINQALDHLQQTLAHQSLAITSIEIAIFGYDRGAAIARGFANKLVDIYRNKATDKLEYRSPRQSSVAPMHLTFLGLIDSVSTAAESNPVSGQLPLFKASLKDRIKLSIPSQVQGIVHMAAVHDARFYMRIDQLDGTGDKYRHYLYPGCQEDVGGGLPPGCHGKSNDFAKLPARRMLAAAYRAGVPVYSFDELKVKDPQVWKAFQFAESPSQGKEVKSVEALYAAYRAAVSKMSEVAVSKEALHAHTVLWIKYLAIRYGKGAMSSEPALQWTVNWLKEEVRWLRDRQRLGNALAPEARRRPLGDEEKVLLNAWETALQERQPLPAEVVELFDNYLHDGVALSRLQRAFSEFWQDVSDDRSLYLRPRAVEVVEGPGWQERLQEIRERNRRDPKVLQRNADAESRLHRQDEAARLAREKDRQRAGIAGYSESR